jgi:hypothetical protein
MPQNELDLAGVFQKVTQALADNQSSLNQSDAANQDHGDNMVQTFQTITHVMQKKRSGPNHVALASAAKELSGNASSASGKMYAQNLAQAAEQFQGKTIDAQGALQLLQTLIGSGQAQEPAAAQSSGVDLFGTLLSGLTDNQTNEQPASQNAGMDMLGTLLGGLTGEQTPSQSPAPAEGDLLGALLNGLTTNNNSNQTGTQDGLDMGDLLNAGMAFLASKQSGQNNLQALTQALMAGSGMGQTPHRSQSTQIVVNSFLQALSSSTTAQSQTN